MKKEIEIRDYVSNFCDMYSYPSEAKETILYTYDKITEKNANALFSLMDTYEKDMNCDFGNMLDTFGKTAQDVGENEFTAKLLLLICFSKHLKEIYKEKGLSEKIWYDSVADLKWKLFECKSVKGVWGNFVADWSALFFNLKMIALGRLQYEVANFNGYYEKDGMKLTPSTKVIQVHIPRTMTPLDEESCEKSYREAKEFFKEYQIDGKLPIVCESWLLYKENEKLFSNGSNTMRYFKQFDILKSVEHGEDNPDIWRLFDMEYTPDLDKLPCDTSLRKAYVEHLKKGGKTGYGYGIFFY